MRFACNFLRRNTCSILFFVIYSVVFLVMSKYFLLFLPFLLSIMLYFLIFPLYRLILTRLHLSVKASIYTACIVCFLFLGTLIFLVAVLLCREALHLFNGESYFHFDALLPQVQELLKGISARIPVLTEQIVNNPSGTLSTLLPYAGSTLKIFFSIPAALILPVLSFAFSCAFLRHRRKLRHSFSLIIGPENHLCLRHTIKKQSGNSSGFIFSYILIYLITFSEASVILSLLNMPYPLITALIVTVSDFFPVLGPGAVLLPLCVYRLLCGAYAQSIGLLAGWLLITVIRQIIEPRLISKISRTPSIVMLTAVYASLVFGNFWIIPYTALLFYLYNLFADAGIFSRSSKSLQQ